MVTSPKNTGSHSNPSTADRLEQAYARYGASVRKQRAWDTENPGNRAARHEVLAAIWLLAQDQLAADGRILDVGCGTGNLLEELATSVEPDRLYGIDAAASRVQGARRAIGQAHIEHADARALPFKDHEFDFVILFSVLLEMPTRSDIALVISECDRVLARGGLLVIYEPRLPNPLSRRTRAIRRRDIPLPVRSRTIRLLPPIARRLGRLTSILYPRLSSFPPLRSHRLWWYEKV